MAAMAVSMVSASRPDTPKVQSGSPSMVRRSLPRLLWWECERWGPATPSCTSMAFHPSRSDGAGMPLRAPRAMANNATQAQPYRDQGAEEMEGADAYRRPAPVTDTQHA